MPHGAKSMRASEIPKVFSPGSCETVTGVTLDPTGFDVFPSMSSPLKKKSLASTSVGSLQENPFTSTATVE